MSRCPMDIKNRKVFKLNHYLCGLKQSARNLFLFIKDKLDEQGFNQSNLDACLFLHEHILVLVYVGNCIFFASDKEKITNMLKNCATLILKWNRNRILLGFLGF